MMITPYLPDEVAFSKNLLTDRHLGLQIALSEKEQVELESCLKLDNLKGVFRSLGESDGFLHQLRFLHIPCWKINRRLHFFIFLLHLFSHPLRSTADRLLEKRKPLEGFPRELLALLAECSSASLFITFCSILVPLMLTIFVKSFSFLLPIILSISFAIPLSVFLHEAGHLMAFRTLGGKNSGVYLISSPLGVGQLRIALKPARELLVTAAGPFLPTLLGIIITFCAVLAAPKTFNCLAAFSFAAFFICHITSFLPCFADGKELVKEFILIKERRGDHL